MTWPLCLLPNIDNELTNSHVSSTCFVDYCLQKQNDEHTSKQGYSKGYLGKKPGSEGL